MWSGSGWRSEAQDIVSWALSEATPAQWCRGFFLLAAAGVLGAAATPREARALLADYGARKALPMSTSTPTSKRQEETRSDQRQRSHHHNHHDHQQQQHKRHPGWFVMLVATVTRWGQIPHSWFTAFYGLSLACSIFWLTQYLADGTLLHSIASHQAGATERSATLSQVVVGWAMMFLQAARRIYEHVTIIQPSKSTIWFVHWVLGLAFYLAISVSVWVEGSSAMLNGEAAKISAASLVKMLAAIPLFYFAWVNQYRCHTHLAGLKKYSLPTAGLFSYLVCPHYTCECLIYVSLALAAAPEGELLNATLMCSVFFVLVNLGVTAWGTRRWYAAKFGEAAVAQKWNMIPGIF